MAIGAASGYHLASLKKLETFKLLNVTGLLYDLFGVLIHSEVVATSEKIRSVVVNHLPRILISAHFFVPMRMAVFGMATFLFYRAAYLSGGILATFATIFTFAAFPLIFFVEDVVLYAKIRRFRDPLTRSRILGAFFIVVGIVVQLIAAIQDVFS